jgi:hypothetical protein
VLTQEWAVEHWHPAVGPVDLPVGVSTTRSGAAAAVPADRDVPVDRSRRAAVVVQPADSAGPGSGRNCRCRSLRYGRPSLPSAGERNTLWQTVW